MQVSESFSKLQRTASFRKFELVLMQFSTSLNLTVMQLSASLSFSSCRFKQVWTFLSNLSSKYCACANLKTLNLSSCKFQQVWACPHASLNLSWCNFRQVKCKFQKVWTCPHPSFSELKFELVMMQLLASVNKFELVFLNLSSRASISQARIEN